VSFVQIRGSVPVFWQQLPTLKYAAKIEFTATAAANSAAAELHFNSLTGLYGDVTCVNLINKSGSELRLGTAFAETVAKYSPPAGRRVRYEWFDFHHECRKMKWENLSILVNNVAEDFGRYAPRLVSCVLCR
jgi:phosphatidylinositol 4-phosphatase